MTHEAVERLREMVAARDWNGCRDAVEAALAGVSIAESLALAEAMLRRGLATFEREHPGESWPRDALDGKTNELSPECGGPGGNSFANGVLELVDARRTDDPAARRKLIVDALSSAIMANLCAHWGAAHPERWRAWYEAAEDGPPLGGDDPMRGWDRDPAVVSRERALWADLADRLDALLAGADQLPDDDA